MTEQSADLDFDGLIDRMIRATDPIRGTSRDGLIADSLARTHRSDRVAMLRNKIAIAAMRYTADPTAFRIEQPLVEAFVRVHHHPRPPEPMPVVDPGAPRLLEILSDHSELGWDVDRVQALLVQAVKERVNGPLPAAAPPSSMPWGIAAAAAHVLFTFVTLRALGDLDVELTP